VLGDGQAFKQAVSRIKEHIAAGEVFQVVLSRRRMLDCSLDPITVYRALRMVNPSFRRSRQRYLPPHFLMWRSVSSSLFV